MVEILQDKKLFFFFSLPLRMREPRTDMRRAPGGRGNRNQSNRIISQLPAYNLV